MPLLTGDDLVIGAMCVADYVRRDWRETDVITLTHLASAVMAFHEG